MITIGITYQPDKELFYSGLNYTALTLSELFLDLNYKVILLYFNSDHMWWKDFPSTLKEKVTISNVYETKNLDW